MAKYRKRSTGEVFTDRQIKKMHNTSFSTVIDTFADLGYDRVHGVAKPEPTGFFKAIRRDGEEEIGGKWFQKWVEVDLYAGPNQAANEAAATLAHAEKLQADVYQLKTEKANGEYLLNGKRVPIPTALPWLQQAKGRPMARTVLTVDGVLALTGPQAATALIALDDHIQVGLENHAVALHGDIEAVKTDIVALQAIDLTAGWPT